MFFLKPPITHCPPIMTIPPPYIYMNFSAFLKKFTLIFAKTLTSENHTISFIRLSLKFGV
jgi:hypothetical protein